MTLNPEDIARRTFALEERGYDRDEVRTFLFEVAAAMRLALHGSVAPLHLHDGHVTPDAMPGADADLTPPAAVPAHEPPAARASEFLMELALDTDPAIAAEAPSRPALTPQPIPTVLPPLPDETPAGEDHAVAVASERPVATGASGEAVDAARPAPAPADDDVDHFTQLGAEVAEVLRAAHDAVALIQQQAEADADATRARAEVDGDDIRRQAQTEATWHVDRAKRVLMTAQEQAEGIIAEAEEQARAVLTSARDQAEEHAAQVASRARHHAEQILRAERESLRRLHEAQAHVAEAIEMLADAESRPVVDLTDLRPNVRFGYVTVDMEEDVAPATSEITVKDPVARMVRAAVGRAVTGAAEHAEHLDGDLEGDRAGDREGDLADPAEQAPPA